MTNIDSTGNRPKSPLAGPLTGTPARPAGTPPEPLAGPKLKGDATAVSKVSLAVPKADAIAGYPTGKGGLDLSHIPGLDDEIAALKGQAEQQAQALQAADRQAHEGNVVSRGFNSLVNLFGHKDDALGLAKAQALNGLTHGMNDALARYHDEVQARNPQAEAHLREALGQIQARTQAYDTALQAYKGGNKFWSGIAADTLAGLTVVAGVALTATGLGAPIGVPLMAAGAFVAGGAMAVGAHSLIDNQFDFHHEALSTFAIGGVGGVAAALTGGASEALTAGLGTQAARLVGQEAIQGAAGRFVIGAAANSLVGAGFGAATSATQAISSGASAEEVLEAAALGAAGGAVGGVAAHGLGTALGATARQAGRLVANEEGAAASAVRNVLSAAETNTGRAVTTVAQGMLVGGSAGGAGAVATALASGKPIDYDQLRNQILAGALQGGAFAAGGLAGKLAPRKSAIKAPPTPEEAQRQLQALAPRGNKALAEQHGQLVEQYRTAQQQALGQMEALRTAEARIAPEVEAVRRAELAKTQGLEGKALQDAMGNVAKAVDAKRAALLSDEVGRFDQAMQGVDRARAGLLQFADQNLPKTAAARMRGVVGEVNPDVAYDRPLSGAGSAKHNEAVAAFLQRFPDLQLPPGVAGEGVKGLSPRALQAVSEALNTAASSGDMKGAANVEHLSSVLRGVLETSSKQLGRPLTQAEVDTRAAVTVLTDAWMKGASPAELQNVRTALTNSGATGEALWDKVVARSLGMPDGAAIPGNVKPVLKGWFEGFQTPRGSDEAVASFKAQGLTDAQARTAADTAAIAKALGEKGLAPKEAETWARRVATRDMELSNPFLLGTWTHGIPAFDSVANVVKSMGGDHAMAQAYYEEVLAHHASGFVMNGFAKGGVVPEFYQMARAGQLTPEAAQRLTNLYQSSTQLSGKWRPVIDGLSKPMTLEKAQAFRQQVGLKPLSAQEAAAYQPRAVNPQELQAFRRAYAADATSYRQAIEALPANSRSQLLNDDLQQFTEIGMPKWIGMMNGPAGGPPVKSMGELVDRVYKNPVQGYAEENYARGASVGEAFDAVAAPIGQRLGQTFDPASRTYRPAADGEPALQQFAARIRADRALSAQLAADKVNTASASDVVNWLRAQKPDPGVLNRLVSAPEPAIR